MIPLQDYSPGSQQLAARWAEAFNAYFLCKIVLQFRATESSVNDL